MNTIARQLAAIAICSVALTLHPQDAARQAQPAPGPGGVLLQVRVNAVLVPVVVRDAQGHAVGNLKQEDFKVFDQGKRRPISGFSMEQSEAVEAAALPAVPGSGASSAAVAGSPAAAPQAIPAKRFIVFLFDDRHLGPGELEQAKKAGIQLLGEPLADGDRAVVLSFLGVNSGMTRDRAPLQAAIAKLKARQVSQYDPGQCPDIDYYTADELINKHSKPEWDSEIERAANCSHMSSKGNIGYVEQLVRTAANQSLVAGDQDVRATLDYIRDIVHTLSKLPGQRTLILVSPGFLSGSDEAMTLQSQILDLAASSNVTISALDARGLISGNIGAASSPGGSIFANITGQPVQDHLESMRENEDAMAELADGTGGTFFRNSNDLEGGLRSLAAGPEYLYLLEFSLQDVKPNGAYHSLKVEVDRSGLKLQARRGYFAPLPPNGKK